MTRKTHEMLVADWQANAAECDDANYFFLRSLKLRSAKNVDSLASELHREAFAIIDCTQCANCCRTMRATFSEVDVARVAAHVGMSQDAFIETYLERDADDGVLQTKSKPCPFLSDNKCTIYDVRPEKCQGYPFTDQPRFASLTMTHANNAVVCPAVYYVVEQLRARLKRK